MSGCEWIVEAHGCEPLKLADLAAMRALFADLVSGMGLHAVEEPLWHQFPGPGGITGLTLLAESHIACHTFPEFGSLCLNVFCCAPRAAWPFEQYLAEHFGADRVTVRQLERPYGALAANA
jgi:S-adenosylmethionine decarboxylase